MKSTPKQIVWTIVFLFTCFTSFAQTADNVIDIDFKNLQPTYEATLKNKTTFVIHLLNVNRNLYKVDGVKTEKDFNVTLPSAFTGIKLPGYLFTQQPNQVDKNGVEKFKSLPRDKGKSLKDIYNNIKTKLEEINRYAAKLDDAVLLANEFNHLAKNCSDTKDAIISQAKDNSYAYINGSRSADPTKLVSSEIAIELETYLNNLIKSANASLTELNKFVTEYENQSGASNKALLDQFKENENEKAKSEKALAKPKLSNEVKAETRKLISFYALELDKHPDLISALKSVLEEIKANQSKAKATIEEMDKFQKDDKIYSTVQLFKLVTNPSNFEYTSEVITAKTDEISYSLTVEPTLLNSCETNSKKVITIVVKTEGGLKIDFSTGLFYNVGNDDFMGRTYYYQNIDADNRKILSADRGKRGLLSVGALMHFYKRSTKTFKLGGSLGVSTSASFSDLLFHAGPSIIIGNKNRVVVSGGLTLKSSALLDQNLQLDTSYTKLQSPDAIPTVSVFPLAGYFFALTYNITKLSKAN